MANTTRQCDQEFLTEFLVMYKSLPCLWKMNCAEYNNKLMKNNAYELLTTKLKEVDCHATVQTVKKKIDGMRGVFRKEYKKVCQSMEESGGGGAAGTGKPYTSRLWYYNLLLFLKDQDIPRTGMYNIDNDYVSTKEKEGDIGGKKVDEGICGSSASHLHTIDEASPSTSRIGRATSPIIIDRSVIVIREQPDTLHKVSEDLNKLQLVEDNFDIIGKNIAYKLRNLPPSVAIMSEKLIMEVLVKAHLGHIDKNSKII